MAPNTRSYVGLAFHVQWRHTVIGARRLGTPLMLASHLANISSQGYGWLNITLSLELSGQELLAAHLEMHLCTFFYL